MNTSLHERDERQWLAGKSGGELSPPATPAELEQRRQFLGLRPTVPYVPTPPKPRRRRATR